MTVEALRAGRSRSRSRASASARASRGRSSGTTSRAGRERTARTTCAPRDRSARRRRPRASSRASAWRDAWAVKRVDPARADGHEVDAEQNLLLVKGAVPGPRTDSSRCAGNGGADCTRARRERRARARASRSTRRSSRPRSSRISCTRRCGPSSTRSAPARSRARAAASSRVAAPSRGARRAPAARVPARSVPRSSPAAVTSSRRFRARSSSRSTARRRGPRSALRSPTTHRPAASRCSTPPSSPSLRPSAPRRSIAAAGLSAPLVVVLTDEELVAAKSFRNLERVAVVAPSELEVGAVVWARSLLVSEAALPLARREGALMHAGQIVLAPIVSEKSYHASGQRHLHLPRAQRRAQDADPPGRRGALRGERRARQRRSRCSRSPSAAARFAARRPGWKKAIVQLKPGQTIEVFEGAQL